VADFSKCKSVSEILELAKNQRAFHFDQGQDWWNIQWSGSGACDVIALDWIRRKLLGKRSLGDKKYETGYFWNGPGRQKLGRKHVLLHRLFQDAKVEALQEAPVSLLSGRKEIDVQNAFNKVAKKYNEDSDRQKRKLAKGEGAKLSGFERLLASSPGAVDHMDDAKKRADSIGYLLNEKPSGSTVRWGVLLHLTRQSGTGHELAMYRQAAEGSWAFFDPNYGEFNFLDVSNEIGSFVSSFWNLRYPELTNLMPMLVYAG
jgi:hypothetical protein